jgi:hypothetical protein
MEFVSVAMRLRRLSAVTENLTSKFTISMISAKEAKTQSLIQPPFAQTATPKLLMGSRVHSAMNPFDHESRRKKVMPIERQSNHSQANGCSATSVIMTTPVTYLIQYRENEKY